MGERQQLRSALRARLHEVLRRDIGALSCDRICPRCASDTHGRPVVRVEAGAAPQVSLSYADGLAVVAWTWSGPVGIDVEVAGPDVDGVGDRQEWTRVEALLKATGQGLSQDPCDLPSLPTGRLQLPDGYVGTVAGTEVSWRAVSA